MVPVVFVQHGHLLMIGITPPTIRDETYVVFDR
jgi:hypothetical protein